MNLSYHLKALSVSFETATLDDVVAEVVRSDDMLRVYASMTDSDGRVFVSVEDAGRNAGVSHFFEAAGLGALIDSLVMICSTSKAPHDLRLAEATPTSVIETVRERAAEAMRLSGVLISQFIPDCDEVEE